ncbi:MAG: hypothetical protein ACRDRT_11235, partial [Pseudonocardiaceae bacterium]
QEDSIERGEFPGPQIDEPLAVTQGCYSSYYRRISSFQIMINDDEPFYTGAPPTPVGFYDLEGTVTHEFGHASGRRNIVNGGHFSEDDDVCPDSYVTRHTMCPSYDMHTSGWRTPQEHDISTHHDAYY